MTPGTKVWFNLVDAYAPVPGTPMKLWQRWRRFSHRAAAVQSHVVLFLLYGVAVIPVATLTGLNRQKRGNAPAWNRLPPEPAGIESARRQF